MKIIKAFVSTSESTTKLDIKSRVAKSLQKRLQRDVEAQRAMDYLKDK